MLFHYARYRLGDFRTDEENQAIDVRSLPMFDLGAKRTVSCVYFFPVRCFPKVNMYKIYCYYTHTKTHK